MEKIENANYLVRFPKGIEQIVKNGVDYATKKKREYCKVFGCKMGDIPQIKASIFLDREEFVSYIKQFTSDPVEPWVSGCYYNDEIQVFADGKDHVELNRRMGTIAHETVHLMFSKLIYEKYKIERVVWLDESFANYLDGVSLAWTDDSWQKLAQRVKPHKNFDVNKLNNINKIVTSEYDGYDMFHIIGKYIFENNLQNQILATLIGDKKQIVKLGKTILSTAIDWFFSKQ